MKPCYNCEDRQMAAAGAVAAALVKVGSVVKPMLPGATSAAGNAFARQKQLEWSAPDCGKRPFFIGKRRNEWEQCAAKQKAAFNLPPAPPGSQSFAQKNKMPLIIGGIVVTAGIVYFLTRKKK